MDKTKHNKTQAHLDAPVEHFAQQQLSGLGTCGRVAWQRVQHMAQQTHVDAAAVELGDQILRTSSATNL